jgi:hypothetical protein
MKRKNILTVTIVILLTVACISVTIYSVSQFQDLKAREARLGLMKQGLKKADSMEDDTAAVAAYKRLTPSSPEIQLRILQRQWRIAMELMHYLQRAQSNPSLQSETGTYLRQLKAHFDEMIDRSSGTLADAAKISPEIAWRLYNVTGSARAMNALVMLEGGESVDKVQGVMRDALTDFKAAIEAVDKGDVPPQERNIPRWNFELLNGEEYVQKFDVALTDVEKNQVLKDNLETLIPELGGYAPGEPIETIIKK